MATVTRAQIKGLNGLEVAALLGYDAADVRGLAVEPGEVRVGVAGPDGEPVTQVHEIEDGP